MEARIVLSTVEQREQGEEIARTLVSEGLIACGTIFPKGISIYRWRGAIERSEEWVLLLKTKTSALSALEARFRELHPYEVPEFITLVPERVTPDYLEWLCSSTGETGDTTAR